MHSLASQFHEQLDYNEDSEFAYLWVLRAAFSAIVSPDPTGVCVYLGVFPTAFDFSFSYVIPPNPSFSP